MGVTCSKENVSQDSDTKPINMGIFDLDDDLMSLSSRINVLKDGKLAEVTLSQYYEGSKSGALVLPSEGASRAFLEYTELASRSLIEYLDDAIVDRQFQHGLESFKECVMSGNPFCVLSARRQSKEVMYAAIKKLICSLLSEDELKQAFFGYSRFRKIIEIFSSGRTRKRSAVIKMELNVSTTVWLDSYLSDCLLLFLVIPDNPPSQIYGLEESCVMALELFIRTNVARFQGRRNIIFEISRTYKRVADEIFDVICAEHSNVKFQVMQGGTVPSLFKILKDTDFSKPVPKRD